MSDCVEKKECRCCNGTNLYKFIDLGTQPLANSYPTKPTTLPEYPLAVNVCQDCWHTQLTHVVSPDLLFKNYLYVSGTSSTLQDYFGDLADELTQNAKHVLKKDVITVLDIACNDGSQLDAFAKCGCITYGVDPAQNLVPLAREKGHDVCCDYWTEDVAMSFSVRSDIQGFDIITAQNVFAHTDDIHAFLRACKMVMQPHTRLLIQTSQRNMYRFGEFDTIYHEHLSFFCSNSMKTAVKNAELYLNNVMYTPIHGGSYLFDISRTPTRAQNIKNVIAWENDYPNAEINRLSTYINFGKTADQTVKNLKDSVEAFRNLGIRVVGYGAAAKGMTVLNYGKIKLDYIIDDNPLKQGRYSPGMNIPIMSSNALLHDDAPTVIIPLAWNFFDEIQKKVADMPLAYRPKFIKYFPSIEII